MENIKLVTFYVDLWPGCDVRYLSATTTPGVRTENLRRIAFNVPIKQEWLDHLADEKVEVVDLKEIPGWRE